MVNIASQKEFNFNSICGNLEDLDVSQNIYIDLGENFGSLLKRCSKLKKLCLKNVGLAKKINCSSGFINISSSLEEFDCSDNLNFDSSEMINYVINACQKLKILNISNCDISSANANHISFYNISPVLREINVSKNYFDTFYFINQILN